MKIDTSRQLCYLKVSLLFVAVAMSVFILLSYPLFYIGTSLLGEEFLPKFIMICVGFLPYIAVVVYLRSQVQTEAEGEKPLPVKHLTAVDITAVVSFILLLLVISVQFFQDFLYFKAEEERFEEYQQDLSLTRSTNAYMESQCDSSISHGHPGTFYYGYLYRDGALHFHMQWRYNDRDGLSRTLENVNLEQFTCIDHNYAHDGTTVWFRGSPVAGADPATFTFVSSREKSYSKDKSSVYLDGKLIQNADPATFTSLRDDWGRYSKDAKRVYFSGLELEGLSPSAFTARMENETTGHRQLYDGYILNGYDFFQIEDPETFEYIGKGLYKDKHRFYSNLISLRYYSAITVSELSNETRFILSVDERIMYIIDDQKVYANKSHNGPGDEVFIFLEEADAETFELYTIPPYARDKNSLYWEATRLENSDSLAHSYVVDGFLVNGLNVYFESQYLEGINPDTMQIKIGEEPKKVIQDGTRAWVYEMMGCVGGKFVELDINMVSDYLANYVSC